MNSTVQQFSPLWGNWYLQERIGKGSYGSVYRAVKEEYGNIYESAVKHISIPQKGVRAEDIVRKGYVQNLDMVYRYYDDLRDKMVKEINFCYELRGHTNIVSYEDSYIVPKTNEKGYDIFIRMELLHSLKEYSVSHQINEREVIKLGIDICEALQVLMVRNMMHRDIKPGNIFVNDEGNFKLGDFGEAGILKGHTMPTAIAGTYPYMAPEVYREENADITADIYSLGMVMYRMLNNGKAPFVNPNSGTVSAEEIERSNFRRFNGEKLNPPIACGIKMLSEIILRACEFESEKRWETPLAMKNALVTVRNMIEDNETVSVLNIGKSDYHAQSVGLKNVSPYVADSMSHHNNDFRPNEYVPQPATQKYNANPYANLTYSSDTNRQDSQQNNTPKPKNKKVWVSVRIAVGIALLFIVVLIVLGFLGV